MPHHWSIAARHDAIFKLDNNKPALINLVLPKACWFAASGGLWLKRRPWRKDVDTGVPFEGENTRAGVNDGVICVGASRPRCAYDSTSYHTHDSYIKLSDRTISTELISDSILTVLIRKISASPPPPPAVAPTPDANDTASVIMDDTDVVVCCCDGRGASQLLSMDWELR